MRAVYALIATVLTAVSLSGCGDGGSTTKAPLTPTGTQTIVEVAQGEPTLSTLVNLLVQQNLTDTLSGTGPFTVFAPTDAAFTAIAAVTATLTSDQLTDVLLNHVVSGLDFSSMLTNNEAVSTLFADHKVTVTLVGDPVVVTITSDGDPAAVAHVTVADVNCSNGVVHIVDAVLVPALPAAPTPAAPTSTLAPPPPPSSTTAASTTAAPLTPTGTQTIVEVAQGEPTLSTLVSLLVQQNLTDTLSGTGPFTVFAPTDAAFTAIASVTATLTSDQLTDVLLNHVVSGLDFSSMLTNNEAVSTLFADHKVTVTLVGDPVVVTITSDGDPAAVAHVTLADVNCSNGVVHIVDAVLVPALPTTGELTLSV